MGQCFAFDYTENFILFGPSHLLALMTILFVDALLVFWVWRSRSERLDKIVRYTLAILLITQELSLSIWRLYWHQWHPGFSLPLHLCGAAIILSAVLMINKSYRLYEIIYFWGLAGAIQALMTPDIGGYAFPHYRYFQFFLSHGLIITACLYATFVFRFRTEWSSLRRVFIITNIYMVLITLVNLLSAGNYPFICDKPETASLLDYLGPCPGISSPWKLSQWHRFYSIMRPLRSGIM